jgi:peptidoglycan hydrolase CwlO-like protein
MRSLGRKARILACLVVLGLGALGTGCSRGVSQAQLDALAKACQEADAAEQRLASLRSEISQLQSQVNEKKARLDKIKRDTDAMR